jgi:hypothetical protein
LANFLAGHSLVDGNIIQHDNFIALLLLLGLEFRFDRLTVFVLHGSGVPRPTSALVQTA